MKKIVLGFIAILVAAKSIYAAVPVDIECQAMLNSDRTYKITATIVSATELAQVTRTLSSSNGKIWVDNVASIKARSDAWEMSPQEGMRFYFSSGNISTFLLIADGVLETALQADKFFVFNAQDIFEQYENGGSQDIANMICKTK